MTIFEKRAQAARKGHKIFDAGRPCPQGHPGIYYTASGQCVECAKINSRQVYKEMREAVKQREGKG